MTTPTWQADWQDPEGDQLCWERRYYETFEIQPKTPGYLHIVADIGPRYLFDKLVWEAIVQCWSGSGFAEQRQELVYLSRAKTWCDKEAQKFWRKHQLPKTPPENLG